MKNIYILLFISTTFFGFSQGHFLAKVPLSDQVSAAKVIAEGKVVSKKSYWDKGKKNIYTVHTVDVSKSYKGSIAQQLHIVTRGGTVGLQAMVAHPNLSLEKDASGVFVAEAFPLELEGFSSSVPLYRTIGVSQGFYRYDKSDGSVINPFENFSKHETLDDTLISLTRQVPKQLKTVNYFEVKKKLTLQANAVAATAITSISPTQIAAGNKSVLTINGSGFGSSIGTVRFKNADDAGATTEDALETQIVSWTDTQIKVEVPGKAGSGDIEVETSGGGSKDQISGLVITHSYITVRHSDANVNGGKEMEYRPHHVASATHNGSSIGDFDNGAYLFKYHTDFKSNSAAVTSFEDGFDPIVCGAGIDFKISTATTTVKTPAVDNINSISFDAVQTGVLGQATGYYQGYYVYNNLGSIDYIYYSIREIDYVFDQSQTWDFDLDGNTTLSEYDFNAVVRHETGHAGGLRHVIDSQKLMHYSLPTGPHKSTTSNSMFTPIQDKITYDKGTSPPGGTATDFSSCYKSNLSVGELVESPFAIFPNPTSGVLNLSSTQPIQAATVYNVLGKRVHIANEADGIGTTHLSFNVQNFAEGVYFVSVTSKQGSQSLRFIKE